MAKNRSEQLRIIGGRWRSRQIHFLNTAQLRPTPNRVRETLFNWLTPFIEQAICLDLFAGSGALGFEAISRGAQQAQLIDSDPKVCAQLLSQISLLDAHNTMTVHCSKAQHFLAKNTQAYTVLFVDPPFNQGLLQPTLQMLAQNGQQSPALASTSLVYVEHSPKESFDLPDTWHVLRQSQAAEVQFCLLATTQVNVE